MQNTHLKSEQFDPTYSCEFQIFTSNTSPKSAAWSRNTRAKRRRGRTEGRQDVRQLSFERTLTLFLSKWYFCPSLLRTGDEDRLGSFRVKELKGNHKDKNPKATHSGAGGGVTLLSSDYGDLSLPCPKLSSPRAKKGSFILVNTLVSLFLECIWILIFHRSLRFWFLP